MLITVASEYEQYSLATEPNINTPRYKTTHVMNDDIIARLEETLDIQSEHIFVSALLHLPHEHLCSPTYVHVCSHCASFVTKDQFMARNTIT